MHGTAVERDLVLSNFQNFLFALVLVLELQALIVNFSLDSIGVVAVTVANGIIANDIVKLMFLLLSEWTLWKQDLRLCQDATTLLETWLGQRLALIAVDMRLISRERCFNLP